MTTTVEAVHARVQEGEYRLAPIGLIDPSKTNPRQTFNEEKLAELAESIRKVGIVEPLIVRPKKKRYELVSGERRLRAAKLAGLVEVPCMVRELSDVEALEVQIVENDQRADVHPLEQMQGYQLLLETPEYGGDRAKLADRIGKSVGFIHKRLKLRDATEPVQTAFRAGRIKSDHATMIAREPIGVQKELLEACLRRGWSTRQLQEHILCELRRDVAKGGFDPEDATLVKHAPACSACPKLSGNCAELHEDLKSKTSCTDVECFQGKQQAHLRRTIATWKKDGEQLVQIRVGYDFWPERNKWPETLDASGYVKISGKSKKCDEARPALIVHGEGIGKVVSVCCSPKCKVHTGKSALGSRASDEKRKEEQRAAKREDDLQRVVRGRLVDALLDATSTVPAGLSLEAEAWLVGRVEDWVEHAWERMWSDAKRPVRKRHPEWDADTIPIGDLALPALVRLQNEIVLGPKLMVTSYGEKGVPKDLRERCEAAGIDWAGIEKAVRAEVAEKGKKRAKGKPLAEVLLGDATDTGSAIEYRATKGGPVLARIALAREPQRLVQKYGGASTDDLGWFVDVAVRLGTFVVSYRVHANEADRSEPWASTTPALTEAYGEIAVLMGMSDEKDAPVVVEWASTRRVQLGGVAIAADFEQPGLGAWDVAAHRFAATGVWPEPNEHGRFVPEDCYVVRPDLKSGGSAGVYLVPTREGWRESFEVETNDGARSGYPSATGAVYASASAAMMFGLQGLLAQDDQYGATAKGKKQWKEIRAWALELLGVARKAETERQLAAGYRDPADPEATEANARGSMFDEAIVSLGREEPVEKIECVAGGRSVAGIHFRDRSSEGYFVTVFVSLPTKGSDGLGVSGPLHADGNIGPGESRWVDADAARREGFGFIARYVAGIETHAGVTKQTRAAAAAVIAWLRKECPAAADQVEDVDAATGTADDAIPAAVVEAVDKMVQCRGCSVWVTRDGLGAHEGVCEELQAAVAE